MKLYKNPISLIGMALAAVAFTNILFLFFLDAFSRISSPYVGILAYMVAPAIMVVGLVMIPLAWWWSAAGACMPGLIRRTSQNSI